MQRCLLRPRLGNYRSRPDRAVTPPDAVQLAASRLRIHAKRVLAILKAEGVLRFNFEVPVHVIKKW
jgi:hypothetical protein